MLFPRTNAYLLGVRDGYRNPVDLGSGLTWDSDTPDYREINEAYDSGVNAGQYLAARVKGIRCSTPGCRRYLTPGYGGRCIACHAENREC